jgi:hypothetical protein
VHVPVQAPVAFAHTYGQTVPVFCQLPAASQVWGWRPLHFLDEGTHAPVQAPPLQTFVQAAPMFFHTPVASHT